MEDEKTEIKDVPECSGPECGSCDHAPDGAEQDNQADNEPGSDGVEWADEITHYLDDSWDVTEEDVGTYLEFLTFTLENEEYGINVLEIKELIRPVGLTFVPRSPDIIDGIVSLRGVIIPMLNLKKILKLDEMSDSGNTRYIFVQSERGIVGFKSDKVNEVIRITEKAIEPSPAAKDIRDDLLSGVARFADRMIILLDFSSIIDIIEVITSKQTGDKAGQGVS